MDARRGIQCTRRSGPANIEAIRADSLAEILGQLSTPGESRAGAVAVSDLSLGAWRGHQIATELLGQFAQDGQNAMAKAVSTDSGGVATNIGFWIDAETRGDIAKLKALQSVKAILAATGSNRETTFLVVAPRFGHHWGRDNEFFLHFLASCLTDYPHRLVVAFPKDDSSTALRPDLFRVRWLESRYREEEPSDSLAQAAGLLALIPGVIDSGLAAELSRQGAAEESHCFPVGNGRQLVPVELRKDPGNMSAAQMTRLLPIGREHGWIASYLMYYLPEGIPDFGVLIREAWYRLSEGSGDIASKLMDRTLEAAFNEEMRSAFQIQYQWMRIASHRFQEAGDVEDPTEALDRHNLGTLYWQKAWGLVMSERPRDARMRFEKARDLLEFAEEDVTHLYFLNIYALSLLRTGDFDEAMVIEREIEQRLAARETRDWHMAYINNLNIARLLRRKGDLEGAERHYGNAFDTTEGARTGIDGLYINASMALLNEVQARHADAFLCWFRACLHWVALEFPETLGWRVLEAIKAERRDKLNVPDNPEDVSNTLLEILVDAAQRAQIQAFADWLEAATDERIEPPVFVSDAALSTTKTEPAWEAVVGSDGWGMLVSRKSTPPEFEGAAHRKLRALLYGIAQGLCPALDLSAYRTFGLDDRNGTHIPHKRAELIEVGILRGAGVLAFESEIAHFSSAKANDLKKGMIVRLGLAVRGVEPVGGSGRITFSRYFNPQVLTDQEQVIVKKVCDEPQGITLGTLVDGMDSAVEPWSVLQSLRERRVIDLGAPSDVDIGWSPPRK